MAWPVSNRFIDFIANVTAIAHDFLNAIQDAVVGLYGGTKTVKKLQADGVGDQAASAADGNVEASGKVIAQSDVQSTDGNVLATNSAANSGHGAMVKGYHSEATYAHRNLTTSASDVNVGSANPTVPQGYMFSDGMVLAWASVVVQGGNPQSARGYNTHSIAKGNQAGFWTVELNLTVSDTSHLCAVATPVGGNLGAPVFASVYPFTSVGGRSAIGIVLFDKTGNYVDESFNLVVFGL